MTQTVEAGSMRNGVDTATLFATLDAVKAQPAAAKFQFRASNAHGGRVDRRGRHRPARHPRLVRRGSQRLRADPGPLRGQGRCGRHDVASGRRAVPETVRRLRRSHERRAGHDRRRHPLTMHVGQLDGVVVLDGAVLAHRDAAAAQQVAKRVQSSAS